MVGPFELPILTIDTGIPNVIVTSRMTVDVEPQTYLGGLIIVRCDAKFISTGSAAIYRIMPAWTFVKNSWKSGG